MVKSVLTPVDAAIAPEVANSIPPADIWPKIEPDCAPIRQPTVMSGFLSKKLPVGIVAHVAMIPMVISPVGSKSRLALSGIVIVPLLMLPTTTPLIALPTVPELSNGPEPEYVEASHQPTQDCSAARPTSVGITGGVIAPVAEIVGVKSAALGDTSGRTRLAPPASNALVGAVQC